jgi:hypothetical protein
VLGPAGSSTVSRRNPRLLSEGSRRFGSMWGCGMGFGVDQAVAAPRANRRLGGYPSRLVGMPARRGILLSANSRPVFRSRYPT